MLISVATEIHRILKPGGFLVMCEETDTAHIEGAVTDRNSMCTIGRSVSAYKELFPHYRLRFTQPRRIEPTYPRPDVGTYMLIERPSAA